MSKETRVIAERLADTVYSRVNKSFGGTPPDRGAIVMSYDMLLKLLETTQAQNKTLRGLLADTLSREGELNAKVDTVITRSEWALKMLAPESEVKDFKVSEWDVGLVERRPAPRVNGYGTKHD